MRSNQKQQISAIKSGLIPLYCHFYKIIKEPGTSFRSLASSQKYVRNVCQTAHQYLTKFHSETNQDSKEIGVSVTSMTQQCYDDVADQEICRLHKNIKFQISQEQNYLTFLPLLVNNYFLFYLNAVCKQDICIFCKFPLFCPTFLRLQEEVKNGIIMKS